MRRIATRIVTCCILFSAHGHNHPESHGVKHQSALEAYDLSGKPSQLWILPKELGEASGLAFAPDDRLFSHNDERGIVYQVDQSNGTIIKKFSLGTFGIKEDFEDIAIVDTLFYLMTSSGVLYEFPEGSNGQRVDFKRYATVLSAKNDVEGLVYDPVTNSLLMACKGSPGNGHEGYKAVYTFSLKSKQLEKKPRFLIPLNEVTKNSAHKEFKPSAIAFHPIAKTFFVLAAHGESIIELKANGRILNQKRINAKINPHPEGIAFSSNLTMYICNDGQGKKGSISAYAPTK